MQWSDITAPPPPRMLRQFAGLFLIVFVGLAGWRYWQGDRGQLTMVIGAVGLVVGTVGLITPTAVRWIYTGWMVAAFPIGWTISVAVLGLLFYGIFTPIAIVFRLMRRDALRVRHTPKTSYWAAKEQPRGAISYFRQS